MLDTISRTLFYFAYYLCISEATRRSAFMNVFCMTSSITSILVTITVVLSYTLHGIVWSDLWVVPTKVLDAVCFGLQTLLISTVYVTG